MWSAFQQTQEYHGKVERENCELFCVFFFQAEDGIRDYKVTGVQTCALPILSSPVLSPNGMIFASCGDNGYGHQLVGIKPGSEGKPGTSVWSTTEVTPYVPT